MYRPNFSPHCPSAPRVPGKEAWATESLILRNLSANYLPSLSERAHAKRGVEEFWEGRSPSDGGGLLSTSNLWLELVMKLGLYCSRMRNLKTRCQEKVDDS